MLSLRSRAVSFRILLASTIILFCDRLQSMLIGFDQRFRLCFGVQSALIRPAPSCHIADWLQSRDSVTIMFRIPVFLSFSSIGTTVLRVMGHARFTHFSFFRTDVNDTQFTYTLTFAPVGQGGRMVAQRFAPHKFVGDADNGTIASHVLLFIAAPRWCSSHVGIFSACTAQDAPDRQLRGSDRRCAIGDSGLLADRQFIVGEFN